MGRVRKPAAWTALKQHGLPDAGVYVARTYPSMKKHISMIGAGPTSLGAAYRLSQIGYEDWCIYEKDNWPGGLASSFVDEYGFTWDIGGHVQFSHYPYFDELMDVLLEDQWFHHERESWVWLYDRFIPYPFQSNIRHLPKEAMWECVQGLVQLYQSNGRPQPANFRDWIYATFGDGIARHFMLPYNLKVWAYPLEGMNYVWIGDRVAIIDLNRVLHNIFHEKDDVSWGPNNKFRFPRKGGTGSIWRTLADRLPDEKIKYNKRLERIETAKRRLYFADGSSEPYEILLSTMPLDLLVFSSDLDDLKPAAGLLKHSSANIIGLGLRGSPAPSLRGKCWIYFPEKNCAFYRVTVFSHYSPHHVPDITRYWSLMFEVSESPHKPVNHTNILDEVIEGALNTKLIESRDQVACTWTYHAPYGYPIPSLQRDEALNVLLPALADRDIYSRGRFGAWKYEVSNQDHSAMQGVECINNIIFGTGEITVFHPSIVNGR